MYPWSPLPRSASATLRDAAHPKAQVRLSAIGDLVRWAQTDERERCVERLLELLERDEEVEVRAAAALALADAEATGALPRLLNSAALGPPRVRQMALVALGELAPPAHGEALACLRVGLGSEAPALRFQALVAAGRLMPREELSDWLVGALGDAEPKLRYIACRIIEERFFAAGSESGEQQRRLESELEPLLRDTDSDVVIAAAVLLAPRSSEPARRVLVEALNARRSFAQPDDEQAAIELCGQLGLRSAMPGLRARAFGGVFGGPSPLAFQARVALARLGDERARRYILRGLSSWSRNVRAQCVAAAGLARLEAARPRLLQMRGDTRSVDEGTLVEALLALDR